MFNRYASSNMASSISDPALPLLLGFSHANYWLLPEDQVILVPSTDFGGRNC